MRKVRGTRFDNRVNRDGSECAGGRPPDLPRHLPTGPRVGGENQGDTGVRVAQAVARASARWPSTFLQRPRRRGRQ